MTKYSFFSAFKSRKDLKEYGSSALSLFALELFFGVEDVKDDSVIDGGDDGGLDVVYIDIKNRFVVIAQDYEAKNVKKSAASSKKARDLSHGLTLLLKLPIEKVPNRLKPIANELRSALSNGEIENVHIWFVHNLPGSKNVKDELQVVEQTAAALLKDFGIKEIKSLEVCADELEQKWSSISTLILVKDSFKIPYSEGFTMKGDNWKAFVTSVPLSWLYQQFKNHGTNLFSANVRDYLGIVNRDKNINKGIQATAQKNPDHFWVFNNGITALVNSFKTDNKFLEIDGLSILNGAQTTGTIGNLGRSPSGKASVQMRFVVCTDKPTVIDIKRFNNSQNKIEAPDFRSNDQIQERLVKEFKTMDLSYSPRRGGIENIIKRKPNTLSSVVTGQILSAFHGRPDIAYHKKTEIWENDALYSDYFNEQLSAKHVIFVFSLFEAVRKKKLELNIKNKNQKITDLEKDQHLFFQTRGSIFLLTAGISNCLQIFLDTAIPNRFRLEFNKNFNLKEAIKKWEPIIDIVCNYLSDLQEGFSDGAVRQEQAQVAIMKFTKFIAATKQANKSIYSEFSKVTKLR
jgi:hypothetical protein